MGRLKATSKLLRTVPDAIPHRGVCHNFQCYYYLRRGLAQVDPTSGPIWVQNASWVSGQAGLQSEALSV